MLTNKIVKTKFDFVEMLDAKGSYPKTVLFNEETTGDAVKTYENMFQVEQDHTDNDTHAFAKHYFDNGGAKLTVINNAESKDPAVRVEELAQNEELREVVMFAFTDLDTAQISTIDTVLRGLEAPNQLIGVFYTNDKSSELTDDLSDYSIIYFNEEAQSHAVIPAYFSAIKINRENALRNIEYLNVIKDGEPFQNYIYKGTDYDDLIDKDYNFIIQVSNKTVLAGGVTATGVQIAVVFATITMQREIQKNVSLFLSRSRPFLNAEGVAQVRSVVTPILEKYRSNGILGGFSDEWKYATQTVEYNNNEYVPVRQGDVLPKGYVLFIPGEISSEDIGDKKLPPIYLYLIMQGNIRAVKINGKVGV